MVIVDILLLPLIKARAKQAYVCKKSPTWNQPIDFVTPVKAKK